MDLTTTYMGLELKNPLRLDSKPPSISLEEYAYAQTRFSMLTKLKPERARELLAQAQKDIKHRWQLYEQLAAPKGGDGQGEGEEKKAQ